MKKKTLLPLLFFSAFSFSCFAQDSLMTMAQAASAPGKQLTIATFKDTRLIDQQTVECLGPRTLNVEISHRFGQINSGSYNAWGIDGPASLRIGVDYSFDGRLMAGIGRTAGIGTTTIGPPDKLVDGFLKYRLIRQTEDNKTPLSLTLFAGSAYTAEQSVLPDEYNNESDRFAYTYEMMVARKFSSRLSLQFSGYLVHNNITRNIGDKNDIYAAATCVRYKITRSFAITAEYAYRINDYSATPGNYYDSMGIGLEIETGGHVFQIFVTNSVGINETQFIPYTTTSWSNGGIHVGFNISRVFHL